MAFKIYADFESLLKEVRVYDKKNDTPYSFASKVVCVDDKFSKPGKQGSQ